MFDVVIYQRSDGYSPLDETLTVLSNEAPHNKDSRIQLAQIKYTVDLLKECGTRLSNKVLKHLIGDIWELRPGKNRILFFYFKESKVFVLLHIFTKKTQKTPKHEIEKAVSEMNEYIKANGGNHNENLGATN